MSIPGLLTAMVTPYQEDLGVDYVRAAQLAEYLCDNGSEALVVSGTTGESPVLKVEEKIRLFAAVKERVGDRVPVWAGTGSNDTAATVELSKKAEKLGIDGIMLVTPYYNKPTQEGLYRHFKAAAESVQVPIMLYNVPGRTSSNLLPETIARLTEIPNIKAVKEASGNMDQVSLLGSLVSQEVVIYSGDDSLTLPLMAIGAQGVVSIASHIVGKEIRAMVDAFKGGEVEKARQIHLELFPIFKGLFVCTNPIPVKEALNMMGKGVGGFRPPLCEASESEREFIRQLLGKYKLI
ncbi:MAG: 4-hydroxy-tetrahydrodipicolinate synthase [Syntrophomonadaceae bacterium]|jgi:4-hydroxy-tetrahydrodipicolinate synthase|nr:4-hydroxy-tetrahydrodipicolinate synthase [Syntrophomonadaceae bacterium]